MKNIFTILITVLVTSMLTGCGPSTSLPLHERQQNIRDMEAETLARLYKEKPSTEKEIAEAAGYGVFSNANVNIILISAGGGYGVVKNNKTGKRTYMKMALGGVGLGLGAKDYRQVLVFKSDEIMDKFIYNGWEFGGHADAAAKAGESGGEASGSRSDRIGYRSIFDDRNRAGTAGNRRRNKVLERRRTEPQIKQDSNHQNKQKHGTATSLTMLFFVLSIPETAHIILRSVQTVLSRGDQDIRNSSGRV